MRMIPIASSAVAAVGYDEVTETLQVQFTNGRTYVHREVPESVFKELLEAPSAGSFYAANIKGNYG